MRDSATSLWKNKTISTIFGGTPLVSVPTLTQVTTTGNTTTNSISVGGLTVSTNLIYTDTVNNRVGIKTLTPGVELDVVGSIRANSTVFTSIVATQTIKPNSITYLRFANSTYVDIGRYYDTGDWVIQNGGTFTDAGYRLDVNGTLRAQNKLTVVQSTAGQNIQEWYNSTTLRASMNDVGALYLQNLEGTDGPVIATSGTLSTLSGWTGTITIVTNPPGQQNIQVDKGIIVNVF